MRDVKNVTDEHTTYSDALEGSEQQMMQYHHQLIYQALGTIGTAF
jgi:hypothetical protein